jgi:hypothetical protein
VYIAAHEAQRGKAIRRAQNEAAGARQKLAAIQQKSKAATDDFKTQKAEADELNSRTDA